ncbi:MAG: choice-of-anchor B family protein, partial [Bacteroidota bacterium]
MSEIQPVSLRVYVNFGPTIPELEVVMNRIFSLALLLALASTSIFSQQAFNTVLRSRVQYPDALLNDIWGYTAPDGTEYALVGKRNGVSIVSLADPDNAVEVDVIPGQQSVWRDLKAFGDYAYVVADQGNEGLTIIDLSTLPDSVTWTHNNLQPPGGGTLNRAHNIYIDTETGLAYISGSNLNGGGMLIYDIASNPGSADFVAFAPNIYAHDVYVQDGRMYASEINIGRLAIYDVSDPRDVTFIGERETPFAFTHNAWTTADGNYVFTTDERADAPVAAYDISDPSTPVLIDEFRPGRSVGSSVIPHNVHVLNEYLAISYYTDGLEIVDVSVPDNGIEVAYYDTWLGGDGGFNGSWGAYPFLPSGLVLATDIANGLFVIEVDYKRGARLKGLISDADLGTPLNDVTVTLSSPENANTATDAA